jgi:hypothetical protein
VGLGDGHREVVPVPRLPEPRGEPDRAAERPPGGVHVGVLDPAVAADVRPVRVRRHVLVQVAVARRVVVDPEDVRRARGGGELPQLGRGRPGGGEVVPERVVALDPAAQ